MKVAIVTYDEYINIPYIQKYEEIIKNNGSTCDIVLWDRRGRGGDNQPANHYVFSATVKKSKLSKIVPFIKWRYFTIGILKAGRYDKIIVLTTLPAILIYDFLLHNYSGHYFFDLRDYTYESCWLYKKLVNTIIRRSAGTSISSSAFMQFLEPSQNIFVTHNLSDYYGEQANYLNTNNMSKVTIGFVGGVRYYEENCRLLTKLKNSKYFRLRYVGKVHPGCDLQDFCRENQIKNVDFFPAFTNNQKPDIYQEIDLINAVYGNKTYEVQLALPNKLYDCVMFKKPIIVSSKTYLASIVEQYNLGLAVDTELDDIEKAITNYLMTFNAKKFDVGCRDFLRLAREEEKIAEQRIKDFLKET